MVDPKRPARGRVEVILDGGRRRRFTAARKSAIVEETLAPGASVSEVARRHGLSPQQVFTWRRLARVEAGTAGQSFVPAVVAEKSIAPAGSPPARGSRRRWSTSKRPAIEIERDGLVVRVARGADAKTVAAILRALKDAP